MKYILFLLWRPIRALLIIAGGLALALWNLVYVKSGFFYWLDYKLFKRRYDVKNKPYMGTAAALFVWVELNKDIHPYFKEMKRIIEKILENDTELRIEFRKLQRDQMLGAQTPASHILNSENYHTFNWPAPTELPDAEPQNATEWLSKNSK